MKRFYLVLVLFAAVALCASAQIGYQVSLLNNATGEPRANEQVTVTVKITDSEGNIVCEETKNETSNDFGVVSMSVGNSSTFANANWSKLPFFIEASVDGRLLGKSQLLSVPVAEYAKYTGTLTKELLCSRVWKKWDNLTYTFYENGRYSRYKSSVVGYDSEADYGSYSLSGDTVFLQDDEGYVHIMLYCDKWKRLLSIDDSSNFQ